MYYYFTKGSGKCARGAIAGLLHCLQNVFNEFLPLKASITDEFAQSSQISKSFNCIPTTATSCRSKMTGIDDC